MHLLSKMRSAQNDGSRFGIVLNGSPLFTGGAGSGDSEFRRYALDNELVEVIIALPTDMFYNTGIATYVWSLTNRKPAHRKGRVQLIDASSFWQKMRKSPGLRISRRMGADFARSWARVSRHSGQPFHGIVGGLADAFMESGLSGLVKRFCDGGAPAEAIT